MTTNLRVDNSRVDSLQANTRWKFMKDDDCHWYLIPCNLESSFIQLLLNGENDYYCTFNNTFEQYRCDSPLNYTFENVK